MWREAYYKFYKGVEKKFDQVFGAVDMGVKHTRILFSAKTSNNQNGNNNYFKPQEHPTDYLRGWSGR